MKLQLNNQLEIQNELDRKASSAVGNVVKEAENRRKLTTMMEDALRDNRLTIDSLDGRQVITIVYKNKTDRDIVRQMDMETGKWLNSRLGNNRDGKQYKEIYAYNKNINVPSYRFLAIAMALLQGKNRDQYEKFKNTDAQYAINHINGNHLDDRIDNLEFCTHNYNTIHGALMKNLLRLNSSLVEQRIYNEGQEQSWEYIVYTDGIGITAKKMEEWNLKVENNPELRNKAYLDHGLYLIGEPVANKETVAGREQYKANLERTLRYLGLECNFR